MKTLKSTSSPVINEHGTVVIRTTRLLNWGTFYSEVRKVEDGAPLMRTGEKRLPSDALRGAEEYCEDNGATIHHTETRDV